jgi:hypothetical protein
MAQTDGSRGASFSKALFGDSRVREQSGSARILSRYIGIAGPRPHAFAHIFRVAGLSVRHAQRKSLRLALPKRSNNRAIGGSLMAHLSQSLAAYRNSERRDDCNSRNPHGEVSLYSDLSSCLFIIFNRKNTN